MSKKLLFILGIFILGVSLLDVFLIYLNVDIPFSLLIIFFLFFSLFFMSYERMALFKDKNFVFYFLILLISLVSTTLINTNYQITSDSQVQNSV